MPNPERPPYLPELPDPWPRLPDAVPDAVAPMPLVEADGTAAPPEPAAPETGAPPERTREVVTGRVGKRPLPGRTPKGQPKLEFQLAAHPDPDTTVWHHVVCFGDKAVALRDWLTSGEPVEVVGYRHLNEYQRRDGSTKRTDELWATNVRSLRPTPADPGHPTTL